ncbi:MAG: putative phage abortive infection protein [Fibrobacteres bacterium]|nr:putative phage abortive infection protein [Fibrobacterota bacterium]
MDLIDYSIWLWRTCASIKVKREFSGKEYLAAGFAAFIVAAIIAYSCAFLVSIAATLVYKSGFSPISASKVGPLGDLFGGFLTPMIAIAAAILTFFAFWVQYRANELSMNEMQKNSIDSKIRVLISQNREIASKLTIQKFSGETAILKMCRELELSVDQVRKASKDALANQDVINIAYTLFFIGVGKHSDKIIRNLYSEYFEIDNYIALFRNIQFCHDNFYSTNELTQLAAEPFCELEYKPFDGHQKRLGHYFRSLFHVLKYADSNIATDSNPNKRFTYDEILEIIKTLRTQLSTYEQVLILANALTDFGSPLMPYIIKYRLVKNIPSPMLEFLGEGINPLEQGDLEWEQIKERSAKRMNKYTKRV